MESIEQINISREQQGNIVKWNCNSTETENSIIIVYNLFFFLQYFIFFFIIFFVWFNFLFYFFFLFLSNELLQFRRIMAGLLRFCVSDELLQRFDFLVVIVPLAYDPHSSVQFGLFRHWIVA